MKKSFLFFTAILAVNLLSAQEILFETNDVRYDSEYTEVPTYVEFITEDKPSVEGFEEVFEPYFKGKDEFDWVLKKTEKDELGFVHYFYNQTYKGKTLQFSYLNLHTKNGEVVSYNGEILNKKPTSSSINISEAGALDMALNEIGADQYKWELKEEEQFIKNFEKDPTATYFPKAELKYASPKANLDQSALELCYVFNIYAHQPMSRTEVYVSANNGSIIFKNDLIHTANSQGTAVTAYSGVRSITTDSISTSQFHLTQTASGGGVQTYDMNTSTNYSSAVDFTDSDNYWNNNNSQLDQYATDAHWGAEQTYDYLLTKHNRNSINNSGFPLISYVHFANNFANAFWNGQYMTYGDGNGGISPLTALDIAGHEIAHGLTTFSANLIYQSESGALNESFSDIFGAAIEFYARPNNANWTIGEDIGTIIRSMSNPKSEGDPDTRNGINWLNVVGCVPSNQNDNCGVHINSGVQNFWFYLLTTGGSSTNDLGNSYSVNAIGMDKAAAVAYRNLTVYLSQNSDYDDARLYAIKSAIDLYGPCSPEVESVTNAWYAVGVGTPYQVGVVSNFESVDTVACAPPHTVDFSNLSSNGVSFKWYFGDGDSSTAPNPVHTYQSFGNYDVDLLVDGGSCGADTLRKQAYIKVDNTFLCNDILDDGFNADQLGCNGTLFDSGGSGSDYGNNEQGILTIEPPNATSVTLNFLSFDVEAGSGSTCNYDYLEIYDGPNVGAPLIGRYCNTTGSPGTITSTLGSITLLFSSDQSVTESGFEIAWSCNMPNSAPTPDFTVSQDSSCTGLINFTDLSSDIPNQWFWDFGDGNTSVLQNPSHQYNSNGAYNVKLIATNNFGTDSILETNAVFVQKPVAPTQISDTVCIGATSTLNASVTGTAKWYASENASSEIYSGNSFTTPPLLSDTSFWLEDYVFANIQSVGVANNNIGTGGFGSFDRHLVFDVLSSIIIDSVTVYANSSGNRIVEIRNAAGIVLFARSYFLSAGKSVLPIGFKIAAGSNYQMGLPSNGTKDLYRTNSGLNYPYSIPGKINIKGSNASVPTNFYYYFYDWKIKEEDCYSSRTEIEIKIDSTCSVTGIDANNQLKAIKLYPNPTADFAYLESPIAIDISDIRVYDLAGKIQNINFSRLSGNRIQMRTGDLSEGIYIVRVSNQEGVFQSKISIIK